MAAWFITDDDLQQVFTKFSEGSGGEESDYDGEGIQCYLQGGGLGQISTEIVGEGEEVDDFSDEGFALFLYNSDDEDSEDLIEGRPTCLETSYKV